MYHRMILLATALSSLVMASACSDSNKGVDLGPTASSGLVIGRKPTSPTPTPAPAPTTRTTKVYYVDPSSGNDANAGTSATSAWRSVTRVGKATLAAGDSVVLKRGGIWYGQTLTVNSSGQSGNPIIIGAYGTGAAPILDGGNRSSGGGVGVVVWYKNYVVISDLEIRNYASGIGFSGGTGQVARRIVVHDMYWAGVALARGITRDTVEDVTVYNVTYNGISPDGRDGAITNSLFRRITAYSNFTAMKFDHAASYNTIRDVRLYNNSAQSSALSFNDHSDGNTVINAVIHGGGAGIESWDSNGTTISSTLVYKLPNSGISFKGSSTGGRVSNSTVYGASDGIYLTGTSSDTRVMNVIVANNHVGLNPAGRPLAVGSTCIAANSTNINGAYTNLGSNVITSDAGFMDATTGNFSLRSGSPCAGKGRL